MKRLQKYSIIICTIALLMLSGCSQPKDDTVKIEHTAIQYSDITYVRPDMEAIDKKIADLHALVATADKEKEILETYESILYDVQQFDTMETYTSIEHKIDVTDDFYAKENEILVNYYSKLDNKLLALTKAILDSSYDSAFQEKMGDDFISRYKKNATLNSLAIEDLAEQETALIQEYQKALVAEYTTTVGDEILSLAKLDFQDPSHEEAYYAIYKQKNKACGELYLKLVQVRVEIAKVLGYDSYAEYAYDTLGYDFTLADTKNFEQAVLKKLAPLTARIEYQYYDQFYDAQADSNTTMDEAIVFLQEALDKEFPQEMQDALAYMLDNDMYIFSDDSTMMRGAFTTILSGYLAPFMFINTGVYSDPDTLFHEFGHYSNFYNYSSVIWNDSNDLNIAEIHSQSLETLMYKYYDDIYKENAKIIKYKNIAYLLNSVLQGCAEDAFQQAVYENPDMTLDEVNTLYASINEKYFGYPITYEWVEIHHHFESPFYYISYATSAISSLELWAIAEKNRTKALDIYDDISKYTKNVHYLDVLKDVGLSNPFNSSIVDEVIKEVRKVIPLK